MPYKDPVKRRAYARSYATTHREQKQANAAQHRESRHQRVRAQYQEHLEEFRAKKRISSRKQRVIHADTLRPKRLTPEHREKQRQRMASWRKANPTKNLAALRRHRESNRDKRNAQAREREAQWTPAERAADAAKRAASRLANLVRYKAHERANRQAHPEHNLAASKRRRARKKGAPLNDLTAAQWMEMKIAYDHRCVYCGKKVQRLTQDHITPLGPDGSHTLHNIVPACKSCNSRKKTGPPLKPVQPLLLTIAPAVKKKKR